MAEPMTEQIALPFEGEEPADSPDIDFTTAQGDAMTNSEFYHELETHDWFHHYSDDGRVYRAGHDNKVRLDNIAAGDPAKAELLKQYADHMFSGAAFGTYKKPKPERPQD